MSLGTIYQSIEILSKEKGIDPKIVLDAVKDAMLVAARKHFRTNEDLVADLDPASGAIQIYGVRRVVAEVADPEKEISLTKRTQRIRKRNSTPKSVFPSRRMRSDASPRRRQNR